MYTFLKKFIISLILLAIEMKCFAFISVYVHNLTNNDIEYLAMVHIHTSYQMSNYTLKKNKEVPLSGMGEFILEHDYAIKVNDSKESCFFSKVLGKTISYGRSIELIVNDKSIGSICATKRSFIDSFINAKIEYLEKDGRKFIRFFNAGLPLVNSNQVTDIYHHLELNDFEYE